MLNLAEITDFKPFVNNFKFRSNVACYRNLNVIHFI